LLLLLLLLLPEVKTKVDDDEDEDDEEGATCDPFWARKEERSFSRDPKKASSFCLMLSFFRVVGVVGVVVVVVVVNGEELLNVGGVVAEWRGGVVLLGGGDALALEFGSTCPAATACCFLSFFFLPNILAPLVHSASLCPDCVVSGPSHPACCWAGVQSSNWLTKNWWKIKLKEAARVDLGGLFVVFSSTLKYYY
jgi:hypothetical protein